MTTPDLRTAAGDLLAALGAQNDAHGPIIRDSRADLLSRALAALRAALAAPTAPAPDEPDDYADLVEIRESMSRHCATGCRIMDTAPDDGGAVAWVDPDTVNHKFPWMRERFPGGGVSDWSTVCHMKTDFHSMPLFTRPPACRADGCRDKK